MTSDELWPSRLPTAITAAIGVTKAQLFFQQTAKWLFREQPLEDYGIDAHVELVESGKVKGRMVALQIKSGDSWLKPDSSGGWVFYPAKRHVAYWQNHSLPVAVVIWQESTDTLFFREASLNTLEETKTGGWRLHFGDDDVLDETALPTLSRLSEGTTYDLRLRQLRLLLPWMQRIAEGQRLILRADEWINKTWGKGDLEIVAVATDGTEHLLGRWGVALGGRGYGEVLPTLFEWADLEMNPDVEWETEEEFETDPDDGSLHPYANSSCEVDHWSLELHLNSVGKAFLLVDEYARQGEKLQLGP